MSMTVAGVRIRAGGGTLLMAALVAAMVYPAVPRVLDGAPAFAAATLVAVGLLGSVLLHELAHAGVAAVSGGRVREIGLTLVGGHTRYELGRVSPWASVGISLAGPATNALLALAAGAALDPFAQLIVSLPDPARRPALAVLFALSWTSTLNWALAVFNILPGLPMDGGRAFESACVALGMRASGATRVAAWVGRLLAIGLCAIPVLTYLMTGALPSFIVIVWTLVVATMLWSEASKALTDAEAHARAERLLDSDNLASAMRPLASLAHVACEASVASQRDFLARGGVYVDPEGRILVPELAALGPDRASAAHTPLSALLRVVPSVLVLPADPSPRNLAAALGANPGALLFQERSGEVRGAVLTSDVLPAERAPRAGIWGT